MSDIITKTLYICYFGLREPLVQTQVLPYLREIIKGNIKVFLLTFEPSPKANWTNKEIEIQRKKLADDGIEWHYLAYHKNPSVPATLYDILNGARYIRKLVRHNSIDILHARVQLPAMMGELARKSLFGTKPKLIFDIRGFFPEEYTDAGVWKEDGLIYKTVKQIEKGILQRSDGFVVLTEKAREILFPESKETGFDKFRRPVEVIPCCFDMKRFVNSLDGNSRINMRKQLNAENRKVVTYVGSFGGWYLTNEMFDFFETAREFDSNIFILILTQRNKEKVIEGLKERGFCEKDFFVGSVLPEEIPYYLSAADFALSFIKKCYSKQASSPTKIAEYLACGLPIISNQGVGDLDSLIRGQNVGLILDNLEKTSYDKALKEMDELLKDKTISQHCRNVAENFFDLKNVAGTKYRSLYKRLIKTI